MEDEADLKALLSLVVMVTLELQDRLRTMFLMTAPRCHYLFVMSDLGNIFRSVTFTLFITINYGPLSRLASARLGGQMSWASVSCFGRSGGFGPYGFKPWSRKPNDLKIDTCRFLARCFALLGLGKDWLAQYQDNVTEWDVSLLLLILIFIYHLWFYCNCMPFWHTFLCSTLPDVFKRFYQMFSPLYDPK